MYELLQVRLEGQDILQHDAAAQERGEGEMDQGRPNLHRLHRQAAQCISVSNAEKFMS